jgi:hypothetical protein
MSDIEVAATVAFSEYITSCTVIVTSTDNRFDHGTGVAVRYRGKSYLLTAAHVLKPLHDDQNLRIIGRPPIPFKNVTINQLRDSSVAESVPFGYSEATSVHVAKYIFGEADEDVVAMEIDGAHDSLPHTIFHDLTHAEPEHLATGRMASAFGFPGEIAQHVMHKPTGIRGVLANSLHVDLKIQDLLLAPDKLNPDINFITDYTFEGTGCNPKGMSGCGIWSHPKQSISSVWSSSTARLLGIQSAFYPTSRLLVALRIERVLRLLSQR